MNNLDRFIKNGELVKKSINTTKNNYRKYDPGWYLYRKITSYNNIDSKFTDEFIELIYVTLIAWNMNSRGAKLSDYNVFKNSIIRNKNAIKNLSEYRLQKLSSEKLNKILMEDGFELFSNLDLVADTKPRLVTYSKTLHFLLPNLFVPIDRKYTMKYFYGHTNIPKNVERQYRRLLDITEEYRLFASLVKISKYKDTVWNTNIPKTIDNMIIGFMSSNI